MHLSGIKAHLWQRISAIYLLFYFPYLAFAWFSLDSSITVLSMPEIANELFSIVFSITTLIAIAMIITHAWVGIRDIMIDYLPDNKVQFWLKAYAVFLIFICIDLLFISYLLLG